MEQPILPLPTRYCPCPPIPSQTPILSRFFLPSMFLIGSTNIRKCLIWCWFSKHPTFVPPYRVFVYRHMEEHIELIWKLIEAHKNDHNMSFLLLNWSIIISVTFIVPSNSSSFSIFFSLSLSFHLFFYGRYSSFFCSVIRMVHNSPLSTLWNDKTCCFDCLLVICSTGRDSYTRMSKSYDSIGYS